MLYIKVEWVHDFANEPVELYSELDDNRWEIRKVEIFRNGTGSYAWKGGASGSSQLSITPIPALQEIRRDPQFRPAEISKESFEDIWKKFTSREE